MEKVRAMREIRRRNSLGKGQEGTGGLLAAGGGGPENG